MNELEGMTFHSAEREVERLEKQLDEARQEAADLRRQLMYGKVAREQAAREAARAEAESWNIAMEELSALLDSSRVEAADLRRQLAECQTGLVAARLAIQAYAAVAAICPTCGGSGEVDSGGVSPPGEPASMLYALPATAAARHTMTPRTGRGRVTRDETPAQTHPGTAPGATPNRGGG